MEEGVKLNNIQHQETVKKAVMPRFRGHTALKSRTIPRYPESAERELRRAVNQYLRTINAELKDRLPGILVAYRTEQRGDSRFDDFADFERIVRQIFQEIAASLEQKLDEVLLIQRMASAGLMTKNTAIREWRRAVQKTLGIDLMEDYYSGDFYKQEMQLWVDVNVLKIKSIPNTMLDEMKQIILDGYTLGKTIRQIQKEIQKSYNVTKQKADMLARDQIATLNAQITQYQQRDAGVSRYEWSTSRDERVRDCHAALEGMTFSWDAPPEMWYTTKKKGIVFTGRHCHPGEDYQCRCCAIPVFDIETIDVPMAPEDAGKGQRRTDGEKRK